MRRTSVTRRPCALAMGGSTVRSRNGDWSQYFIELLARDALLQRLAIDRDDREARA